MKRYFLCALAFLCLSTNTNAQITKEVRKERQELRKISKNEINEKATKVARNDAKKLKKEGWHVTPGSLPWLSGNLVGISINLCKSIQKELFINDTP